MNLPSHARTNRWSRTLVALLATVALSPTMAPVSAQPVDDSITLSSAVIIERVSAGGRTMLQSDAVEATRLSNGWKTPKAGDEVKLANGSARSWAEKAVDKDGWLQVAAGGYAHWTVSVPADRIMILEAVGHSSVMVNGELRTGDPYEMGYFKAPVKLHAGDNSLLFKSARGHVRAKLVPAKAPVMFNAGDVTLPDLLADGMGPELLGSIVVMNATDAPTPEALSILVDGISPAAAPTRIPRLLPMETRKVMFKAPWNGKGAPGTELAIKLRLSNGGNANEDSVDLKVAIRKPTEKHKRTFISSIDGSVQYYAVVPPPEGSDLSKPKSLIVSLHGASVEATSQANCYQQRDWCYVVCPTNRRPYGFDWEDWGRLDALEVLAEACKLFNLDDRRIYLTGHSMGGHGTWNFGVQFPGTFAAIAPSAGWISFWSYAGGAPRENIPPIEELFIRSACSSDTLSMKKNFAQEGVYILHGDADDNVPVEQARTMRKELGDFHADFAYYERPGAGHWWGDECVDWPPLIEFLKRHEKKPVKDTTQVVFTTTNPGASPACDWVTIEQQTKQFAPSSVNLSFDPKTQTISGTTENVALLTIHRGLLGLKGTLKLDIDGQTLQETPPTDVKGHYFGARLVRAGTTWSVDPGDSVNLGKASRHNGLFKTAFTNNVILVTSTKGSPEINAWTAAKARYDSETFWYRGNSGFRIMSDVDYLAYLKKLEAHRQDAQRYPDLDPYDNVILYGNADSNAAWPTVLGDSCPITLKNGSCRVGSQEFTASGTAALFLYPRAHNAVAMVGVVGGTDLTAMHATDRIPYFVSGVGIPDWVVFTPDLFLKGSSGVKGAGFFGNDWSVAKGETVWNEQPSTTAAP